MDAERAHRQQAAREHLTRRHAPHLDPGSGITLSNLPAVERTARYVSPAARTPEDVRAALALVDAARSDLDRAELGLIEAARAAGCSWESIAGELGLDSRQAALRRRDRLRQRADHETALAAPATPAVNKPLTTVGAALRERSPVDPNAIGPPVDAVQVEHAVDVPATEAPAPAARPARPRPSRRRPRATGSGTGQDPYDYARTEDGRYRVTYKGERIGLVVPTWTGAGRTKQWQPRHADNTRIALAKDAYPTVRAAAVEVVGAHVRRLDNAKRQRRRRR